MKKHREHAIPLPHRTRELRMELARKIASFSALTAISPVQYQKQLRLQAARRRMLIDDLDASSAAFEVGYESASQFNREYSHFFGQAQMRDIRTLLSPGAPPMEVGH
jgi:transcriptional regulator GlxA family with amidase domain